MHELLHVYWFITIKKINEHFYDNNQEISFQSPYYLQGLLFLVLLSFIRLKILELVWKRIFVV